MAINDNPGILLYPEASQVALFLRVASARRPAVQRLQPHLPSEALRRSVAEYWHLLNAVTLWDVGVERQIEISDRTPSTSRT